MVIILYALLVITFSLIVGLFIEEYFYYKYKDKLSPTGKLVQVDNSKIHLISKGNGRTPIIIFSGLGVTSPYCNFYNLQKKASSFSKTIIVEKNGYGFSDATTNKEDVYSSVEKIRESLIKSNEKPPYILAAHSYGAIEAIAYAQKYPKDISSIVFMDGASPWFGEHSKYKSTLPFRALQFLKYTGVIRLLSLIPKIKEAISLKDVPSDISKLNEMLLVKNFWNENMINEVKNLQSNCNLVLDKSQSLGDTPIIILTAENQTNLSPKEKEAWINTQKDLTTWSNNSEQIILKDSGHFIHHDKEDVVLIALKKALEF